VYQWACWAATARYAQSNQDHMGLFFSVLFFFKLQRSLFIQGAVHDISTAALHFYMPVMHE